VEKVTLATIANIAEIFAALGLIVSLIYVGYQVREARKAVRTSTAQARTDLGVQLISTRYTSDIADILVLSVDCPETLTKADRLKLKSFFSAHVRHCQNLYYQQQQDLLDDYFSYGVARTAVYWIEHYPWAIDEWRELESSLPPEFIKFINDELVRIDEEAKD
jgi:hypothetical protein